MVEIVLDPLPVMVGAGRCVTRQGWVHETERLGFEKIIVADIGTFLFNIDGAVFTIAPGDFLYIPANSEWKGESEAREGYRFSWIIFRTAPVVSRLRSVHIPQAGSLTDKGAVDRAFDRLLDTIYRHQKRAIAISLAIASVLEEISYQSAPENAVASEETAPHPKFHDVANQAILFMKDNLASTLTIDGIAQHLRMNPTHLRRVFKKATSTTPGQYLRKMRVDAAARLLACGETMVSQVAYKVGFDDVSYFSRVFKKTTGYWPSEYRGKHTVTENTDGEFYPFVRRL